LIGDDPSCKREVISREFSVWIVNASGEPAGMSVVTVNNQRLEVGDGIAAETDAEIVFVVTN
jgi:hypothetical protein